MAAATMVAVAVSKFIPHCHRVSCSLSLEKSGDRPFVYRRASPEVRWPGVRPKLSDEDLQLQTAAPLDNVSETTPLSNQGSGRTMKEELGEKRWAPSMLQLQNGGGEKGGNRKYREAMRISTRRLSKLALKKAKDWKARVRRLSTAICELEVARTVADVMEVWPEQLHPNDLATVLGTVGQTRWRRALELYEWLNLRDWYTPNPRMLAAILGVLGRSGQVALAQELFSRAEPELSACVQVYNALLSAYAKQGQWQELQHILTLMQSKGCEPDIITFNTIANARCKGDLQPGMALSFLLEVFRAGLRPDIVTYNTLLSGCITKQYFAEAREILEEMNRNRCAPDLWTYNLIKSTNGRLELDEANKMDSETLELSGERRSSELDTYTSTRDLPEDAQRADKGRPRHISLFISFEYLGDAFTLGLEGGMPGSLLQLSHSFPQPRYLELVVLLHSQCITESLLSFWILFVYLVIDAYFNSRIRSIWLTMRKSKISGVDLTKNELLPSNLLDTEFTPLKHVLEAGISLIYSILSNLYRNTGKQTGTRLQMCVAVPTGVTAHMLSIGEHILFKVEALESSRPTGGIGDSLGYTKLISEHLNKQEYSAVVKLLKAMVDAGVQPKYLTWTCVLQNCSLCRKRSDLLMLLAALSKSGCPLPLRLVMEREDAMPDAEKWLTTLHTATVDAGRNMVNNLVEVLWAFKQQATAARLFDLAVRLGMYPEYYVRVQEKDWEADFRQLSPGTALVALTSWLIQMQEAALEGCPNPPKEVFLITGIQQSPSVSLNKTLRAHLWGLGSPFFLRKGRQGALVAKGYSVRLWLKDSPLCLNLDLVDTRELPRYNSMELYKDAWMSADVVPVVEQIQATRGEVWPKQFARLAQMTSEDRKDELAARLQRKKRR